MSFKMADCPRCDASHAEHERVSDSVVQLENLDEDNVYYKCEECGEYIPQEEY